MVPLRPFPFFAKAFLSSRRLEGLSRRAKHFESFTKGRSHSVRSPAIIFLYRVVILSLLIRGRNNYSPGGPGYSISAVVVEPRRSCLRRSYLVAHSQTASIFHQVCVAKGFRFGPENFAHQGQLNGHTARVINGPKIYLIFSFPTRQKQTALSVALISTPSPYFLLFCFCGGRDSTGRGQVQPSRMLDRASWHWKLSSAFPLMARLRWHHFLNISLASNSRQLYKLFAMRSTLRYWSISYSISC